MRHRYLDGALLATALAFSLTVPGMSPPSAAGADETRAKPSGPQQVEPSAEACEPEENHASIRLRVLEPERGGEVAVDEDGMIAISGVLHKRAVMVDVVDEDVTSSEFTRGDPPDGVAGWARSWSTSLRPPHLGENEVCARAEREPKRSASVARSFTVVDLIPPSNVPGLALSDVTATTATVTWGAATDNYGLAGYDVSVDGGDPQRTTVGNRSYTITGLEPSSSHTVSVVAVDLAGNRSTTPATVSFTTEAAPPPPDGDLSFDVGEGAATATWHPELPADATYRAYVDGEEFGEFPVEQHCLDDDGSAATPCTEQALITYPIEPLESSTQYEFRMVALRADGTEVRSLSGSFTTATVEDIVPPATTQLTASESSRCAGMGGDFYLAPDERGGVEIPAGSKRVFEGCYTVDDSSCIDAFLPPSGEQILDCADRLTALLTAVAPPGRGPVISSFDDVVAGSPAAGQVTLVEPITWCTESRACTVVLERPAQVVRLAATAPAAGASISWVVVSVGGIAVGLAFWAIWEILFPGEIGIYGLLEYPIDITDDFDAFEAWHEDEGEWYTSLKVYAEMVETTNQLAGEHDLPFAWTEADDAPLRRAIDVACSVQRGEFPAVAGCDNDFAVYVPGAVNHKFEPMPQTGSHIVTAMDGGSGFPPVPERAQWFSPAYSKGGQAAWDAGFRRSWFDRVAFRPNACTGRVAQVCDEFPFWTTNQAVTLSGIRASLQPVPQAEASPQGNDLSTFYRTCDVDDKQKFMVLPVKKWVDAGGPSFGFRVSPGGASLCLVPTSP